MVDEVPALEFGLSEKGNSPASFSVVLLKPRLRASSCSIKPPSVPKDIHLEHSRLEVSSMV